MKLLADASNPDKKCIVHVSPGLDVGGMEKLLVEFAKHADRSRFALKFVALEGRGRLVDEVESCGWPVATLDVKPGLKPSVVPRLARLLRTWGTDVVHTHNSKALIYGGPSARLASVRRVIHTRHGQRFGASRGETILFRLATRTADRIVCVSNDSAHLSQAEGLTPRKLATIWNGIDVSRFTYAGVHPNGPVVMVGRLSPEKDVATLVRAAAIVVREHPAFRVQVAGDGVCLPELQRLTSELGLSEIVTFLGVVRDIPALLRRAGVFVLPSLTEGVSLTLLEAMAVGLPVVATRVGGNPEVVSEGETGLLVPPRRPDELAIALLGLLRDPGQGRRMGLAGRQRVEQFFDVRRMVADYEALYLGLDPPGSAAPPFPDNESSNDTTHSTKRAAASRAETS